MAVTGAAVSLSRTVKLEDLLPPAALREVGRLLAKNANVQAIKAVTNKHKDMLLQKGVDADYLAYAILNAHIQTKK